VKNVLVVPTLPSFPAIDDRTVDRLSLLGGLTFVEGATSGWAARDLVSWFKTYGPSLGRTAPPPSVSDAVVGAIALLPGAKLVGDRVARPDDLPKLLAMTRWRVVVTLRGLLSTPCDDRFLQAAIFADRVRREGSAWRAQPRDTDLLSDVVLSLFAVDVLSHREFHEQNLCVCDVCGRISYNPQVTTRSGCADHVPKTDTTSGFQGRGSTSSIPPPRRTGPGPRPELRSAEPSSAPDPTRPSE
jgi:hypothetical protein